MRKLRSTCRVWNTFDMHSMSWGTPMHVAMEIHGGVWATIMEAVKVGRETEYPDPRDLAEALQEAFRVGPREAIRVAEDVFQSAAVERVAVVQVRQERLFGGVEDALLPIFPWWAEDDLLEQPTRGLRSLEIAQAVARKAEIEGSWAERTSIPEYAL